MAEVKVGQKYKRTHGSYAGHVAEVTAVDVDYVYYKPGLYEVSGNWTVDNFLRDWVPVEEPKPEIKVGQKYTYVGEDWGNEEGNTITVTSVSGERIDTAPGTWDFRVLFFSTEADLINSGRTMGYVLAEDVEVEEDNQLSPNEDKVNHPSHYGGDTTYEVIKVAEAWGFDKDAYLFNVLKYIARAEHKGSERQDLEKAMVYLDRKIKRLES